MGIMLKINPKNMNFKVRENNGIADKKSYVTSLEINKKLFSSKFMRLL